MKTTLGKREQLNEFDALTDLFLTELSFQLTPDLPPLVVSHQLQRLDRKDNTYDSLQRQLGFRFDKVLEYNLPLQRFDDDQTRREDFLLVGSTSHQGVARLQLGLLKQVLGKLEYSVERESYKDNLNKLVLGVAGIGAGELRRDMRQFGSAKLIQTASSRVVFQEEFNRFLNGGIGDFRLSELYKQHPLDYDSGHALISDNSLIASIFTRRKATQSATCVSLSPCRINGTSKSSLLSNDRYRS